MNNRLSRYISNQSLGDPQKLKAAGVEPIVDLPGVGLNFQDHYLTFSVYRAKPGTESFDDFVRGEPEVQKREHQKPLTKPFTYQNRRLR